MLVGLLGFGNKVSRAAFSACNARIGTDNGCYIEAGSRRSGPGFSRGLRGQELLRGEVRDVKREDGAVRPRQMEQEHRMFGRMRPGVSRSIYRASNSCPCVRCRPCRRSGRVPQKPGQDQALFHGRTRVRISSIFTKNELTLKPSAVSPSYLNFMPWCCHPKPKFRLLCSVRCRMRTPEVTYCCRNGANANSAIIVSVTPADYGSDEPLAGIEFQRRLEEKAFFCRMGENPGRALRRFFGYRNDRTYPDGIYPCNQGTVDVCRRKSVLPDSLSEAFIEGMEQFGHRIPGFDDANAVVSGIESRTSLSSEDCPR